jgi:hypothetical protein
MTRHLVLRISAACLLLGWLAGMAAAQGFDPPDSMDRYQAEVKRTKLGPALGVDQRTVDTLLKIDQKYRLQKDQAKREALASFQQLQQAMSKPNPSDQEVQVILDRMMHSRQETLNLQQRQFQEEMSVLTPVQQARYLMFLMSMRKQVAQEALELKSGPKAARPLAPPRELPVTRPNP